MMPQGARFSVVLGQRASWPELLSRVRTVEELGFDGLFLVDHFYGLFDLDHPTHEGYTMLAALAPFTQRLRLGLMVAGNTYRNPAFLLKQAMTVDHVSGGRVDFGVGAGWVEREHEAYSFEFPSAKERVDRFAEALEVWKCLQSQERTTFEGSHYTLLDAPFQPKSLQGRLPVLIGGSGPRMMRLTARYADLWNGIGTPDQLREQNARLDDACRAEGRDPASLVRTVSPSINLLTSPEAFEEGVRAYWAAGVRDICFPWPRVEAEVPVLRQVAAEVLPRLRGTATGEATLSASGLRPPSVADLAAVQTAIAAGGPDARKVLAELAANPETRLDGSALMERCGIGEHARVTRSLGRVGSALAGRQLARPWNEAQRGYLMTAEQAELMRPLLAESC